MESIQEKPLYRKPKLTRVSIARSVGKVKLGKETAASGNESTKVDAATEDTSLNYGIGNSKAS